MAKFEADLLENKRRQLMFDPLQSFSMLINATVNGSHHYTIRRYSLSCFGILFFLSSFIEFEYFRAAANFLLLTLKWPCESYDSNNYNLLISWINFFTFNRAIYMASLEQGVCSALEDPNSLGFLILWYIP